MKKTMLIVVSERLGRVEVSGGLNLAAAPGDTAVWNLVFDVKGSVMVTAALAGALGCQDMPHSQTFAVSGKTGARQCESPQRN